LAAVYAERPGAKRNDLEQFTGHDHVFEEVAQWAMSFFFARLTGGEAHPSAHEGPE